MKQHIASSSFKARWSPHHADSLAKTTEKNNTKFAKLPVQEAG